MILLLSCNRLDVTLDLAIARDSIKPNQSNHDEAGVDMLNSTRTALPLIWESWICRETAAILNPEIYPLHTTVLYQFLVDPNHQVKPEHTRENGTKKPCRQQLRNHVAQSSCATKIW